MQHAHNRSSVLRLRMPAFLSMSICIVERQNEDSEPCRRRSRLEGRVRARRGETASAQGPLLRGCGPGIYVNARTEEAAWQGCALVAEDGLPEVGELGGPDVGAGHDAVIRAFLVGGAGVEFFPAKLEALVEVAAVERVVVAGEDGVVPLEVGGFADV